MTTTEIAAGAKDVVRLDGAGRGISIVELFSSSKLNNERIFNFDFNFYSVAPEHPLFSGQADIYEAVGKPIVEDCLNGVNSALFAYGIHID